MKKNIIFDVVLLVVFAALLVTLFVMPKKEVNAMLPENLTVVEAPEQTEAMEHEYFVVEEWVPVVPEGTNVALDAKAEANTMGVGFVPRKSVDGNLNTYYEGAADSFPNELTLDLKDIYNIHAVKICLCPQAVWAKRTQTFEILAGNDPDNMETIIASADYEFDPKTGNEVVLEFDDIEARYVEIILTANTGAVGGQVAEFEVYAR